MTVRHELQNLISRELAINGIHLDETAWLASNEVLAELAYVLSPELHESRISSFGAIFTDSVESLGKVRKLPLELDQLKLARQLADGAHSFLLYEKAKFTGLVFFPAPRSTELELIRTIPGNGGMIVQRNSEGVTKFFRHSGITSHLNRVWFSKPNVKEASRRIAQCIDGIDRSVLNRILEFAFHLLSPASRIGATLVWNLSPENQGSESSTPASGSDLAGLHLSILDERDSAAICHLLSQTDGATFLSSSGEMLQTGVHLRSSQRATALVPEFKGTRHTSGQRFSYDHSDTLVVTISEDGPVTIFSDGANIADLRAQSAEQETKLLLSIAPEKKEEISSHSFEIDCQNCGKTSMIEEVRVLDCEESRTVLCTVCAKPLYSSSCFTLRCSPFKKLAGNLS